MEGSLGKCHCNGDVTIQGTQYICVECSAEVALICASCDIECSLTEDNRFPNFCTGGGGQFRAKRLKKKCSNSTCNRIIVLNNSVRFCYNCGTPVQERIAAPSTSISPEQQSATNFRTNCVLPLSACPPINSGISAEVFRASLQEFSQSIVTGIGREFRSTIDDLQRNIMPLSAPGRPAESAMDGSDSNTNLNPSGQWLCTGNLLQVHSQILRKEVEPAVLTKSLSTQSDPSNEATSVRDSWIGYSSLRSASNSMACNGNHLEPAARTIRILRTSTGSIPSNEATSVRDSSTESLYSSRSPSNSIASNGNHLEPDELTRSLSLRSDSSNEAKSVRDSSIEYSSSRRPSNSIASNENQVEPALRSGSVPSQSVATGEYQSVTDSSFTEPPPSGMEMNYPIDTNEILEIPRQLSTESSAMIFQDFRGSRDVSLSSEHPPVSNQDFSSIHGASLSTGSPPVTNQDFSSSYRVSLSTGSPPVSNQDFSSGHDV